MKRGLLATLGFVVMTLAAAGCGSSSGSGVDASAAIAACNAYCDAYIAAACGAQAFYTTADECKGNTGEHCSNFTTAPAGCQTPITAYYTCRKTQADICGDTGCTNEFNALTTCH